MKTTYPRKPLSKSTAVVTGGSRDIGAGIVLELIQKKVNVISVFRSHAERAAKVQDQAREKGKEVTFLQTDLTTEEGRKQLFDLWKKSPDGIDILVLCASGATMAINVDANMALVDEFLRLRKERLAKKESLTQGTIIFMQSEPGHFHRVINGAVDFLPYYRDQVGPAKRAGEDALRERLSQMDEVGVKAVVICPPEVEDTFNMKLFELQDKTAREKSRELSARFGTNPYTSIAEVASRIGEILENETQSIANGYTQLFGPVSDGVTLLATVYGNEAIYVDTFEKQKGKVMGRLIVNPTLWEEKDEPSYKGKVVEKKKDSLVSEITVIKDHMKGHFRISPLLPGHKSVRIASFALGQLGSFDNCYLSGYESVKFISPVLPGQTLSTNVLLSKISKSSIEGNATMTVNGKETMKIIGMKVKQIPSSQKPTFLLDQVMEASAQAVGLYMLDELKDEDVLPLFIGTGKAEMESTVESADTLLIQTGSIRIVNIKTMRIFTADIEVFKGEIEKTEEKGKPVSVMKKGKRVATISGLQGAVLPRQEVLDKIQKAS